LKREYEIECRWIAFPLHPETPEDGLFLKDLFMGRDSDMDEVRARMKRVAEELGLPMGRQEKIYNSRLAQELGKWAESKGKGDAFHHAAFHAFFAEGKNIRKIPVLLDLARSLDLPGEEAERILRERVFKDAVDSDWEFSRSAGVRAVPTLRLNGRSLVGAQPYEVMERLMRDNNVGKRDTGS